ncbi:PA2928 family protein [Chitinophaga pinensis]|uniref:Uncharacterized protein n=1 Tax=Chitinophaga pinensis (strain ATCC 43595 / DSM 2588 / LMG 13176 / NBRC 15968 / NCIMB 11800 / UQM 2034) TaxID=485918 RepID=A0A979GPC0_CHIPD|nr:PA2928 family protein [Chitinophaga pinensis]ACU59283.1 hypothetical protein Cpin_1787 [Chitinophaga pinensis DSM 2588]
MIKNSRLLIILSILLGILFPAGLIYIIFSTVHEHSRKTVQSDAVIYTCEGKTVLAGVLKEFNAHAVRKGGGMTSVSGSSSYYACAFDLEKGEKLWSVRLNAKNNLGKNWGDAVLLGQSAKYLFFLRNELYVINKEDGKLVAGNKDLKDIADKLMNESSLFPDFVNNYLYDDSLQAVVIKGSDGLAYLLDGNTLQTRPAPAINIVTYFSQKQQHFGKTAVSNYHEQLVTFTKENGQLYAFMDDNDQALLQKGEKPPYGATKAPRRSLYTTAASNPATTLQQVSEDVFLFGGFLKATGIDSSVFNENETGFYEGPYQLLSRGNQNTQTRLQLPDGGHIILHKASIASNATIIITAVDTSGNKRWQIPTNFRNISKVLQIKEQLFILSGESDNNNGEAGKILILSLLDGKASTYNFKEGKFI